MNAKEFNKKIKDGKINLCDYTKYQIGDIDVYKPVFNLMESKKTGIQGKIDVSFTISAGELSIKVYSYDDNGGWTTLNVKPKTIRQLSSILKTYNQDRIDNMLALIKYLQENLTTINYYFADSQLKNDTRGEIVDSRIVDGQPNDDDQVF